MDNYNKALSLESLLIGYKKGKNSKPLLPPLSARAFGGELISVIGRNGIGKSTLLKTLTGLLPQVGGNLKIDGSPVSEYSRIQLARKVGYISTEILRISHMTVYELVSLGRFPHTDWFGRIDTDNRDKVNQALEKTGMKDFSGRLISELSDGERQRAMIALVLAQDTKIIVMDEPTAFLDIRNKFEIIHLLKQLTRLNGKTIIYSTHDFNTAISQSDKIWLMMDDELIEGAPEDLMIKGSFNNLFDASVLRYDKDHGTFSLIDEEKGTFSVSGTGKSAYWTRQALSRAGYLTSDSIKTPVVIAPSPEYPRWKIIIKSVSAEFDNIYELVLWIRKNEDLIS